MRSASVLVGLVVALCAAGCPAARELDGLACDDSGACLEGFLCAEGVCVAEGECGNGRREIGEQCDGDDFGSAACPFGRPGALVCRDDCTIDDDDCTLRCGDGQRHDTEACDDGNDADGDLCGADCLSVPAPALEVEPNDDGTPSLEDDFLASAATGPVTSDLLVAGAVANGDQDVWSLEVEGDTTLTLSLHNRDGIGRCDIRANVRVRDASGAVLFEASRGGGAGCPWQRFDVEAGRTLYIEVFDDGAGGPYLLAMDFAP